MGHGKETPRQKMIGMMYLVLTAMLALNVSKDVLNAFVLVDDGLSRTTENYSLKNEKLYDEFAAAEMINPAKVGPWRVKAEELRGKVKEIYDLAQQAKFDVVIESEGPESPAIVDGVIIGENIGGKDNTDVAHRVLIGIDGKSGKAIEIKQKLIEFREYCISQVDTSKGADLVHSVRGILDTSDPPKSEDGEQTTWENLRFAHIPLISVIPQLTKIQVDVLNVESEMVNYLLGQIGKADFKFNVLSATVIPKSSYVFQGEEFTAEVFLAASDTTQQPTIHICSYDSTFNKETQQWDYKIRGNSETIPVSKNGRGKFVRKASSLGEQRWSGLIEMKAPDGTIVLKPFKHAYSVLQPNVVVAPTKMNVLYLGIENPMEISVPGVSPEKISATVSKGTIKKVGNSYVVQPGSGTGTCNITVYALGDGGRKQSMGTKEFRVKQVPPPTPMLMVAAKDWNNYREKGIEKNLLAQIIGIKAEMIDFDFEGISYKIVGFKISATIQGFLQEQESKNNRFTEGQKKIINNLRAGSQIAMTNIKAVGPSGNVVDLNDIVLKIK